MFVSVLFVQIESVSKTADGLLKLKANGDVDGFEGVDCLIWAIGRNPLTDALKCSKIVSDCARFFVIMCQ